MTILLNGSRDMLGLNTIQQHSVQKIITYLEGQLGAASFPTIPYDMFFGFDPHEANSLNAGLKWAWEHPVSTIDVPSDLINAGFVDGGEPAIVYICRLLSAGMIVPDPYYASVTALLSMDGTSGSTTFTDTKGHSFTAQGQAHLNSAQKKFGTTSLQLDGTGDWIESVDHTDFEFGNGDFTIEGWFRSSNLSIKNGLFGKGDGVGHASFSVNTNANGFYWYYDIGGGTQLGNIVGGSLITADTWFHVALMRATTGLALFVNGVNTGSVTINTSSLYDSPQPFTIGKSPEWSGTPLTGWVDDFRVTKGVARYAFAGFTPPTTAHPAV